MRVMATVSARTFTHTLLVLDVYASETPASPQSFSIAYQSVCASNSWSRMISLYSCTSRKPFIYIRKYMKYSYKLYTSVDDFARSPLFRSSSPTSTVFSKNLPYPNITLNNALDGYHFLEERAMNKQIGKIGAIRRELDGKPCPFCGGHKYQLLLRGSMQPQAGGLFARCSLCQRPRGIDEDLGRILWM